MDPGNDYGYVGLGNLNAESKGAEQSSEKTLEYYQKAADQDVPDGFCGLGDLYAEVQGVTQDYE